jgi:hypothetical protein
MAGLVPAAVATSDHLNPAKEKAPGTRGHQKSSSKLLNRWFFIVPDKINIDGDNVWAKWGRTEVELIQLFHSGSAPFGMISVDMGNRWNSPGLAGTTPRAAVSARHHRRRAARL